MERDELAARHTRARGNPSSLRLVDSGHRTQVANVYNWRHRLQTCATGDAGCKRALLETQVANLRYWRRRLQTCATGDADCKPALLETQIANLRYWRRRLQTCATGVNSLGQGETSGRLTTDFRLCFPERVMDVRLVD